MLYPARWKKITVDQSKVLKNRLFRFLGATRYRFDVTFAFAPDKCIWYRRKVGIIKTIKQVALSGRSANVTCVWNVYAQSFIFLLQYRTGTSIRQAPVFRHLRALRKSPWKFIIWMNELWLYCMLLVSYIQQYFNTSITVLTNQFWKLLIALFKVPNTGAFTVLWVSLLSMK